MVALDIRHQNGDHETVVVSTLGEAERIAAQHRAAGAEVFTPEGVEEDERPMPSHAPTCPCPACRSRRGITYAERIEVRFPTGTKEALAARAAADGTTPAELVREAVARLLDA